MEKQTIVEDKCQIISDKNSIIELLRKELDKCECKNAVKGKLHHFNHGRIRGNFPPLGRGKQGQGQETPSLTKNLEGYSGGSIQGGINQHQPGSGSVAPTVKCSSVDDSDASKLTTAVQHESGSLVSEATSPSDANTGNVIGSDDRDGFKTVTYRRHGKQGKHNRPKEDVVLGAAEDSECPFRAETVKQKHWFHVSRLPLDIDADKMKQYVLHKFGLQNCVCEKVNPRNIENATFNSFKIGIDSDLGQTFMLPDMWPKGIALTRWYFFPRKRMDLATP